MTTLTLELTKKERNAKYRADNIERIRLNDARYHAANSEKRNERSVRYRMANIEKVKSNIAKWTLDNLGKRIAYDCVRRTAIKFKTTVPELRQIVPQELIELKLLQQTLYRLIKEKVHEHDYIDVRAE